MEAPPISSPFFNEDCPCLREGVQQFLTDSSSPKTEDLLKSDSASGSEEVVFLGDCELDDALLYRNRIYEKCPSR